MKIKPMMAAVVYLFAPWAVGAGTAQFCGDEWKNPFVNGVNRLPARATSYSYPSAEGALAMDRTASRMVSTTACGNSAG